MTDFQSSGQKFHSKPTEYNGQVYHSKKEAAYAQELDLRLRANDIKGYERQVRISFDICPQCLRLCSVNCSYHELEKPRHITTYYIDFIVKENDGRESYTEVKGFETNEWKMKWKLLELLTERDPNVRLLLVK